MYNKIFKYLVLAIIFVSFQVDYTHAMQHNELLREQQANDEILIDVQNATDRNIQTDAELSHEVDPDNNRVAESDQPSSTLSYAMISATITAASVFMFIKRPSLIAYNINLSPFLFALSALASIISLKTSYDLATNDSIVLNNTVRGLAMTLYFGCFVAWALMAFSTGYKNSVGVLANGLKYCFGN